LKNLAFLYSGKPDGLLSLQHDCNAIQEILERHNEWEVKANKPLESEKRLRIDLKQYEDKEIENLFIFYTGHAIGDGVVKEKLKLLLLDDDYDIQIFLDSILETFTILPLRTVIVLDACYSGKFIYNVERFDNSIEIITSSLPHEKSSSVNIKSNLSLFTHYFCEAIEHLLLVEKDVNFKNIHDYINEITQQTCVYLPPIYSNNTEMVLTKDRTLYSLLEELKFQFDSSKNLKEKILEYVNAHDIGFQEFIEAESFSKLYSWLLKNKECLTCLLKDFDIDSHNILNGYENDCASRKKKALQSQLITNLIFKIKPHISNKLDKCRVEGWIKYNSGHYVTIKIEEKIIDFSTKGDYKELFPALLSNQLHGKNYDGDIKLNLILHQSLFSIDFHSLKIQLFEKKESFVEVFSITTQLESRYSNFDKAIPQISRWITNSLKYERNQKNKLIMYDNDKEIQDEMLIYPLFKEKSSKLFGKKFNKKNFILLASDYTLLDDNLDIIWKNGIPHVICPQKNAIECDMTMINNIFVQDMREEISYCMDEAFEKFDENLHFIYDNYQNVERFQKAINNIANDTNYDDLKEG
jgi:hypothetical protein